jgi:hypothetical protein
MRPPAKSKEQQIRLLEKEKDNGSYFISPIFVITIEDIFSKYDMLDNKVLGYDEFKSFYECIGRSISLEEFRKDILRKFQSTDKGGLGGEEGITLQGFKDFFLEELTFLIR